MLYDIFKIAGGFYGLVIELEPAVKLFAVKVRPVVFAIVDDKASEDIQI